MKPEHFNHIEKTYTQTFLPIIKQRYNGEQINKLPYLSY